MNETFRGHAIGYWLEMEKLVEERGLNRLIQEIAALRAKVSFYESRVREMEQFRKLAEDD